MPFHTRSTCRACGGRGLERILSLGDTPLANAFLRSRAEFADERTYPLDLYFCVDCSLVQLLDVVSPEALFGHYLYVSGTSDTIAEHNRRLAAALAAAHSLSARSLVVEIGSNDGSLLRCFRPYAARTLGVEPASNLADRATARGIETINALFDASVVRDIVATHGPARIVLANNVLAHVDDTRGFLAACRDLAAPDGTIVVEAPYVCDLVDHLEYDTIYHEHQCYFSMHALARLCRDVGLAMQGVERIPVHGGSFRLRLCRTAPGRVEQTSQVREVLGAEWATGVTDRSGYASFATRVRENRRRLVELLDRLKADGRRIAAYGAAAKGSTLLNFCRIDARLVDCIADKNPLKIGRWSPGMHLPVVHPSRLLERQPDYVLILAWNFAAEIIEQQAEYRRRGGKFIIPIPSPKVV